MSVQVQVLVGYGVAEELTIDAEIQIEETSLSGIYVRAEFAKDIDQSTHRVRSVGTSVPVETERFDTGDPGAAPRIEFRATAGATTAPVTVQVTDSSGATTGETARTGDSILLSIAS